MLQASRLLFLSLLALSACTGREDGSRGAVARWTGEPVIHGPWLRDHLPPGIQTYQRIPHPLGLLGAPKGNQLDEALASEGNVRNLLAIQQALAAVLPAAVPGLDDAPARALIEHLRSPLEIAATIVPLPTVFVGMTLDLRAAAEIEALFAELAGFPPLPALAAPLDADGFGELTGLPVPALVHFDADTGRLAIYGGPSANRTMLASILERRAPGQPTAMAALEAEIDSSGQGYFGWADTSQLLALGALAMPPEVGQMLSMSGIDQLRSVALGMGVADGKGRLKLVMEFGGAAATRPLPAIDNRLAATAVGPPTALALFSVPSRAEFARLESLALAYIPPPSRVQWEDAKSALTAALGFSIEDVLDALGPELIAFSDGAGSFVGLRVRDAEGLDQLLSRLVATAGSGIEDRRVDGLDIRHVSLPGLTGALAALPSGAGAEAPWREAVSRLRTRFYWIEDDGYLYFAGLPQILIDRSRLGPDTPIGDWLDASQGLDLSSSLIAATGSVAHLPRKTYELYVTTMQRLADLSGAEFDVWAMPAASALGLPERGAIGISVNLGDPYVGIELVYESHPAEILFAGGGMAAAAAAGIVAAIAIPAYQDFMIRAQVAGGMNLAADCGPAARYLPAACR